MIDSMASLFGQCVWRALLRLGIIASTLALGAGAFYSQTQTPAGRVDFARDIQPILKQSCYSCHGPQVQMGKLRLDAKAGATHTIRSGQSADSTLYQRVAGIGDQARMPMGGKALDPAQIDTIKRWIDQGAEWPDHLSAKAEIQRHWAFVAPQRPPLPNVKDSKWSKSPIDRFILARLEQEKLKPSAEADRVTLLRRLSLDLIGLPPTVEEVEAFLNDKSADPYIKQVNRLLSSPHYGERWGRLWLDAARYADSDGYEKDKVRFAWFYRDWVINALNRDLPYDRFIVEQIAGDLLPNATQDQRVATGFLRNSMLNEEGGIDPEQFRMEAMFDRMDAIGKSILGITIQCAQCHNHKYDPLTQEEYYRLFAFVNDSHEANIPVYTPAEQQKLADVFRRIRELEEGLEHRTPDWQQRMHAWETQAAAGQTTWTVIRPDVDDISTGGQKYLPMKDGSLLAQGYAPTKHRVKLMTKLVPGQKVTAIRLELLNDPNLPLGGPGRSIKGTGALTEFEVEAAPANTTGKPVNIKIAKATADLNLPETPLDPIFDDRSNRRRVIGPVDFAIDGKEETAWGTDAGPGLRNQPRKAVFVLEKPVAFEEGGVLTVYLSQRHGGWNSDDNQNCNLGRMRLSVAEDPEAAADSVPSHVREILSIPRERRTPAQLRALFSYWRTTVPEWKGVNDEIAALWKQHPEGSSQLVLQKREEMRPTHILSRGDFLKPGKPVEPGVPSFLHNLPAGEKPGRLAFAKWLVDRKSPTAARSFVNRVWQAYFGTGLVATSEDLGTQSEAPSHPELLDWLAVEFMDKGWSQKQLHRLIVTSATYRQSSHVTPELYSRDPYNRLLARGSRFRVDAEIVRDIALSASGLLTKTIGGPSVFPPAPEFLFMPPASYGPKIWDTEEEEDRYRRAIYTFRYRSVPYPMLQTFDAPNGDFSCVRRVRSNTPLQALVTLNEPLFLESARSLALQTLQKGGFTDQQRVTYAFRRCLSRVPTNEEAAELLGFLKRQMPRIQDGWVSAWDLAGIEAAPKVDLPDGATPAQLAAYTALSRVLLNLDETITKE
jgi:mono/diheme cytochrome c family protein